MSSDDTPIISMRGVSKAFGSNVVYRGMDIDVFRGETLTILGGSGTGKSVALKLMIGLLQAEEGSVVVEGQEVEVDWSRIRLDKIAEGFGAHGEYVEDPAEIRGAVERAFAAGRPALVQVVVDPVLNALHMPNVGEFVTWYAGSLY